MLDAAHGVPASSRTPPRLPVAGRRRGGRFAGTIGRAGAFSFYATKTITTGEGGMLVTDDAALADRARTMRLHGIGRDAWKRYTAAGSLVLRDRGAGFKDNLTDLAAAIGLVQLERAAEPARHERFHRHGGVSTASPTWLRAGCATRRRSTIPPMAGTAYPRPGGEADDADQALGVAPPALRPAPAAPRERSRRHRAELILATSSALPPRWPSASS